MKILFSTFLFVFAIFISYSGKGYSHLVLIFLMVQQARESAHAPNRSFQHQINHHSNYEQLLFHRSGSVQTQAIMPDPSRSKLLCRIRPDPNYYAGSSAENCGEKLTALNSGNQRIVFGSKNSLSLP